MERGAGGDEGLVKTRLYSEIKSCIRDKGSVKISGSARKVVRQVSREMTATRR